MIFFTADTHFGHDKLIKKMGRKGFTDIKTHDETLINQINAVVGKNDHLHILGDFAWKNIGRYRNALRCRHVFLTWGNHDKHEECEHVFPKPIPDLREIKIAPDVKVVCSHYPMAYWNRSHYGSIQLYGHCHAQRESTLDRMMPGRRSLDVGLDNALQVLGCMRPFSAEEIMKLLCARPGHDPIEYYRQLRGLPEKEQDSKSE